MKLLLVVLFTCCMILPLSAAGSSDQDAGAPGVNFMQTSLKEALAKAQKVNKLVLLDNYTDT